MTLPQFCALMICLNSLIYYKDDKAFIKLTSFLWVILYFASPLFR